MLGNLLSKPLRRAALRIHAPNSIRSFYATKTELPPLVTGEWLQTQLDRANVKVIDGSFHLPSSNRDAAKEFSQQRIPGATFFDVNEIRDKKSKYPRMMPSAQDFEVAVSQIGVTNSDIVVVYDCAGIYSSPRVWYMLKAMGAQNVAVLNGGFPMWKREGRRVEEGPMTGAYQTEKKAFSAKLNKRSFASFRDMSRIIIGVESEQATIVDARSMKRFKGDIDEAPGMKAGHIPTSVSLCYSNVLTSDGLQMKSVSELKQVFDEKSIDWKRPIVSTCGSGVTAAIINFAIACVQYEEFSDELDEGFQPMRLYDGSWAEYGSHKESKVATLMDNTRERPPVPGFGN